MSTTFKIQYAGVATPIEEVQLTDTSQTAKSVHSSIDLIPSSKIEKSYGTTATNVKYKAYLTTTSAVTLSHATILNSVATVGALFIKITSAGSSATPEVLVTVNTAVTFGLLGVGDWVMIPAFGDSQGTGDMTTALITLSSPAETSVANVEILMGVKQ